MAHHKRGRAKNQRSGCLMCKPHKVNGTKDRCTNGNSSNGTKIGHFYSGPYKQEVKAHLKQVEEMNDFDSSKEEK